MSSPQKKLISSNFDFLIEKEGNHNENHFSRGQGDILLMVLRVKTVRYLVLKLKTKIQTMIIFWKIK